MPLSTHEFTKPVVIGEHQYTGFTIKPLMFVPFTVMAQSAANTSDERTSYGVLLRRARLKTQVTLTGADAKTSTMLTDESLVVLPIHAAKQIVPELDKDEGEAGKVISDKKADGIGSAILFKLGSPIVPASGKPIEELEFLAATYFDIEAVMAENGKMAQTTALLKFVAKPVGMVTMPSWAVDQISMADGMTILTEVLPNFL
jgi:hypothetical protein